MKHKLLLAVAGIFFLLFLGMSWFGANSVARCLEMRYMEVDYAAAERGLKFGQKKLAVQFYRSALVFYQCGQSRGGYYPERSGEYLTAGNCYSMLCQPRAALRCYELGLSCEPWSITLLSSFGGCAFSLGESQKALAALGKGQAIYPLKRKIRPILRKLRAEKRGKK